MPICVWPSLSVVVFSIGQQIFNFPFNIFTKKKNIFTFHYVIKFVSDLRQVGGFLWILQFPPQIKLIATI
jgi:hypothetical protein